MLVRAVALFGHSNSGKTPLGALIESGGRRGGRFLHLDFGENLRRIADGTLDIGLTEQETGFVASILDGTLLDDAHFGIAEQVIDHFLEREEFDPRADILVLNGIPRHLGQARSLTAHGVNVVMTLLLSCSPQDALARKQLAEVGKGHEDRSGRDDHDIEIFRKKLLSFERDTEPVLSYYRSLGTAEIVIEVTARTTPGDAYRMVASQLGCL